MATKQKTIIILIILIAFFITSFLFVLSAYKRGLAGNIVKESNDGCYTKNFSVIDASECKAKCLILNTERFSYKPGEEGGTCSCLKNIC